MMLAAPSPDPAPHSGSAPIVYVAYDYDTPATWKSGPHKDGVIPGAFFRCHVEATGRRHCVLIEAVGPLR